MIQKVLIAAVAEDWAIGKANGLLWHIREDMKYFRKTTTGYPVIMGYRTWLSIGRPLPSRTNIVITKKPFDAPEGVILVPDIDAAYRAAENAVQGRAASATEKCFVIGGAKTYERAMSSADTVLLTHVHASVPDADAFFPALDPAIWIKESESEPQIDTENNITFSFATYRRKEADS